MAIIAVNIDHFLPSESYDDPEHEDIAFTRLPNVVYVIVPDDCLYAQSPDVFTDVWRFYSCRVTNPEARKFALARISDEVQREGSRE